MELIINHTLITGSTLAEVLASKLTAFYNKIILDARTRMIFLLPMHQEIERTDLHKAMFDEIVVAKFDPANPQFWNTKNLYKIVRFLNMASNPDYVNCYIDHGKIFNALNQTDIIANISTSDIIAAQIINDSNHMRHCNKQLNKYCGLSLLSDDELILYDFSFLYMSDDIQSKMIKELKNILKTYPEYIETHTAYAIISCIIHQLNQGKQLTINLINQCPIDITHSSLLEDFYTLV